MLEKTIISYGEGEQLIRGYLKKIRIFLLAFIMLFNLVGTGNLVLASESSDIIKVENLNSKAKKKTKKSKKKKKTKKKKQTKKKTKTKKNKKSKKSKSTKKNKKKTKTSKTKKTKKVKKTKKK